jgi:hypothetical protein
MATRPFWLDRLQRELFDQAGRAGVEPLRFCPVPAMTEIGTDHKARIWGLPDAS